MADHVEVLRFERIKVVTIQCDPDEVEGRVNDALTNLKIDAGRLIQIQSVPTGVPGRAVLTIITFRE